MKNKKENKVSINKKGILAETIYKKDTEETSYITKIKNGEIEEVKSVEINNKTFEPLLSDDNLIHKKILTLPSGVEDYKSKEQLVEGIKNFIHRYVDVSESFEVISAYYVLMSWVYDIFDNVPYLRVRANPGKGKSRFLDVLASVCYKSTFFKVNPTEPVIFRTLDVTGGTLIVDEADYRFTNKTSGMTKILNNGFAKNSSISRNKTKSGGGGYELENFMIFGPKILANRDIYQDDALESRCISEYMGKNNIREEVKENLSDEFKKKAEILRNKLLKFRLDNLDKIKPLNLRDIKFKSSNRSKQISVALATLMKDDDLKHLEKVIKSVEESLKAINGDTYEIEIIEILFEALNDKQEKVFLTEHIVEKLGENLDNWEKLKPRVVGSILNNLNIKRKKGGPGGNTFVSTIENKKQINDLAEYYGVEISNSEETEHTEEEKFEW